MTVGRFLAGIAAVIYSPQSGRYLLLRRAAEKDYAPEIWECLTGRVDQGEGFEDALHRELHEELTVSVEIVHILGTTHFFRGAPSPENELLGVVYFCLLDEAIPLTLSSEHSEYRWLTIEQANALLSAPDPSTQWARRVIERAETIRPQLPVQLTVFQKAAGFELG